MATTSKYFLSDSDNGLLRSLRGVEGIARVIDHSPVIDVRVRGDANEQMPLLPQAISIEVNPSDPDGAEQHLEKLEGGQQCIIVRNVLQYLRDYRRFLGVAFSRLAVSGYLIITVPHQFLLERKLVLPSRFDPKHLRFYTPSTLMSEIEEALDPLQYRVRMLLDNDADYDYSIGISERPRGATDIVACLERIEGPSWWGELESQDRPVTTPFRPSRYPPAGDRDAVQNLVIEPDDAQIQRILVLKLDHRGDFLMAQEAFGLLRKSFPDASIALVCGEWNKDEASKLDLFDRIIPFNFFPEDASSGIGWVSFAENSAEFKKLIGDISYDLAIDLRFYEDTRELLRFVNARITAGIDPNLSFNWLSIPLSLPAPTRDGRARSEFIGAPAFSTRIGEHRGFEIAFVNDHHCRKMEHLIWGPYADLGPGNFEFEILVEPIGSGADLLFDITTYTGTKLVAAGSLKLAANEFPRFYVAARHPLQQFELRLSAPADGPIPRFRFKGLRYVRDGVMIGVHQEEAMCLLVHLIQLRLKYPYTTAVRR
jgi:hypothetical protein